MTKAILCACIGPQFGEPYCLCVMEQLGLPLNEEVREAYKARLEEAMTGMFDILEKKT